LKKVVFSKVAPEDQLGKRTLDELVEYPAWSPDGSTLAYAQHAPQGSGEIRLVDLASGISARLLDTPGEPAGLEWSHDGTAIVYALGGDIRLANPDVPGEWVSTGLSGHSATLSPDDGAIVYQATSGPSKALYRADLMTGEQAVLLSTKKVNYWMPDWRD
jgi:dipeptidyl aminopeptidase/acylaminoacyl peptidase